MQRRSALALAAIAAMAFAATGAARADSEKLNIVSWGGVYAESQKKAFVEPFKHTGVEVTSQDYNGEITTIRSAAESKTVTWDVIDTDTPTALAACAEGVLEKIDWKKLGLDRNKFIGGNLQECAVPNVVYATVLAYDATKFKTGAPTKIADLFDLKKFPGKRALQKSPFVNLEWALIADGVRQSDVYSVLKTKAGVDRAFKKLDTIKDQVAWWEAGAQPPDLLSSGQVVMASAWNGRIFDAVKKDKRPFVIVWDNEGLDWDWWSIVKGGPHRDTAYRFIAFASDPARMADQTHFIAYGPSNKDALAKVDKDMLANLPTAPDNMKTALIVDVKFWADHGDALRQRFKAWVGK